PRRDVGTARSWIAPAGVVKISCTTRRPIRFPPAMRPRGRRPSAPGSGTVRRFADARGVPDSPTSTDLLTLTTEDVQRHDFLGLAAQLSYYSSWHSFPHCCSWSLAEPGL